jgi:CelD/BcsL family acetyltransferase involved in cellulose biosynthesis
MFAAAAFPHLTQGWAYGEGKRANRWTPVRVRFRLDGRIVAFATVLELRVLGLRLVARVNRGPVFLEADPPAATIRAIYRALRNRWGRIDRGLLMIAPALPHGEAASALLRESGYRRRQDLGWASGRVDLTRTEDDIWAGMTTAFRNRCRKSEAAGASVRVAADAESFDWMIARHIENMAEKRFHAVDSHFLHALRANAVPGGVLVFQVMHEGQPVAGMSVVRFGTRAEYQVGWVGEAGRKVNAGNALMWAIIREMRHRGATEFDLGGLREGDGYTRFKRTMNPTDYRLAGEWIAFI